MHFNHLAPIPDAPIDRNAFHNILHQCFWVLIMWYEHGKPKNIVYLLSLTYFQLVVQFKVYGNNEFDALSRKPLVDYEITVDDNVINNSVHVT